MYRLLALALLVFVTGCLPSSGRREEARLFPSDSLSLEVAATVVVDSLDLVWQTTGPEDAPMGYPASVQFGPDSLWYAHDARDGRLYALDITGETAWHVQDDRLQYAYLAGRRGDSLALMNRNDARFVFAHDGTLADGPAFPEASNGTALMTDLGAWFKAVDKEDGGYLARLDADGAPTAPRADLPPAEFRYLGFLRADGDTLFSLSGLRPVVDRLHPDGRRDSLLLVGFASTQLNRSRQYLEGDIDEPPRLTSSAALTDDYWFVLNLRAGWLRIDVYDRAGQLQHVLESRAQNYRRSFYPLDLAVRETATGYHFAVVMSKPRPSVAVYAWTLGAYTAVAGE